MISCIDQQYHLQNQIIGKTKNKVKNEHPDRISAKTLLSETKNSLEAIDLEYIFEVLFFIFCEK